MHSSVLCSKESAQTACLEVWCSLVLLFMERLFPASLLYAMLPAILLVRQRGCHKAAREGMLSPLALRQLACDLCGCGEKPQC